MDLVLTQLSLASSPLFKGIPAKSYYKGLLARFIGPRGDLV